jgi:hypothetical protein
MTTLSDILQNVLIYLGDFKEGRATDGSRNTVVDSTLGGAVDDYNNGTVFITYDAGGEAGAPEGEFAQVTDYAEDSGTITCATNSFTVAVAASDYYGVSTKKWPLYKLISLVNSALSGIGDLELVDTTTLDTASSQTEYACELAWKRSGPKRIDIQGRTGDANDNRWYRINNGLWEYVPATAGGTALIVFKYQPTASRDLRIWYKDKHPAVRIYSSEIREEIHPEHLVWETVYRALRWKKGMRDAPSGIEDMLKEADQRRQEYGFLHKPRESKRRGRLLILGGDSRLDEIATPDE